MPNTIRVRTIKHGKKLSLGFMQQWGKNKLNFEAFSMSDGTLRGAIPRAVVVSPARSS